MVSAAINQTPVYQLSNYLILSYTGLSLQQQVLLLHRESSVFIRTLWLPALVALFHSTRKHCWKSHRCNEAFTAVFK